MKLTPKTNNIPDQSAFVTRIQSNNFNRSGNTDIQENPYIRGKSLTRGNVVSFDLKNWFDEEHEAITTITTDDGCFVVTCDGAFKLSLVHGQSHYDKVYDLPDSLDGRWMYECGCDSYSIIKHGSGVYYLATATELTKIDFPVSNNKSRDTIMFGAASSKSKYMLILVYGNMYILNVVTKEITQHTQPYMLSAQSIVGTIYHGEHFYLIADDNILVRTKNFMAWETVVDMTKVGTRSSIFTIVGLCGDSIHFYSSANYLSELFSYSLVRNEFEDLNLKNNEFTTFTNVNGLTVAYTHGKRISNPFTGIVLRGAINAEVELPVYMHTNIIDVLYCDGEYYFIYDNSDEAHVFYLKEVNGKYVWDVLHQKRISGGCKFLTIGNHLYAIASEILCGCWVLIDSEWSFRNYNYDVGDFWHNATYKHSATVIHKDEVLLIRSRNIYRSRDMITFEKTTPDHYSAETITVWKFGSWYFRLVGDVGLSDSDRYGEPRGSQYCYAERSTNLIDWERYDGIPVTTIADRHTVFNDSKNNHIGLMRYASKKFYIHRDGEFYEMYNALPSLNINTRPDGTYVILAPRIKSRFVSVYRSIDTLVWTAQEDIEYPLELFHHKIHLHSKNDSSVVISYNKIAYASGIGEDVREYESHLDHTIISFHEYGDGFLVSFGGLDGLDAVDSVVYFVNNNGVEEHIEIDISDVVKLGFIAPYINVIDDRVFVCQSITNDFKSSYVCLELELTK